MHDDDIRGTGGVSEDDGGDAATLLSDGAGRGGGGKGYGCQGLQRWFMTHLFNAYGTAHSGDAKALHGDSGSAYEEVVHRFMLGLVGVVVGTCSPANSVAPQLHVCAPTPTPTPPAHPSSLCLTADGTLTRRCVSLATCAVSSGSYVLALGPRRPSDIMLTPQGFVTCCSLSFTDGSPDPSLHYAGMLPPCSLTFDMVLACRACVSCLRVVSCVLRVVAGVVTLCMGITSL